MCHEVVQRTAGLVGDVIRVAGGHRRHMGGELGLVPVPGRLAGITVVSKHKVGLGWHRWRCVARAGATDGAPSPSQRSRPVGVGHRCGLGRRSHCRSAGAHGH